jgi:hypothetical protein
VLSNIELKFYSEKVVKQHLEAFGIQASSTNTSLATLSIKHHFNGNENPNKKLLVLLTIRLILILTEKNPHSLMHEPDQ